MVMLGLIIMSQCLLFCESGNDFEVMSWKAPVSQNEWIDLSQSHSIAGSFYKLVIGVCTPEGGAIGPDSGQHQYSETVIETDPPPPGENPPWSGLFDPVGSTGPYTYNWSFGLITLGEGQGYNHNVVYGLISDRVQVFPGIYRYPVPAVEHWAWGYYIEGGFWIDDHAKRTNGSETSHSDEGEIVDDCGGHPM